MSQYQPLWAQKEGTRPGSWLMEELALNPGFPVPKPRPHPLHWTGKKLQWWNRSVLYSAMPHQWQLWQRQLWFSLSAPLLIQDKNKFLGPFIHKLKTKRSRNNNLRWWCFNCSDCTGLKRSPNSCGSDGWSSHTFLCHSLWSGQVCLLQGQAGVRVLWYSHSIHYLQLICVSCVLHKGLWKEAYPAAIWAQRKRPANSKIEEGGTWSKGEPESGQLLALSMRAWFWVSWQRMRENRSICPIRVIWGRGGGVRVEASLV